MTNRKVVRVKDVMKREFEMVDGLMSISQVLEKMNLVETKCVIVDKRHDDDVYGIVLISDIARQVLARDRAPDRVNVYEIMSKPVVTVEQDMDIRYCARLFEKFGLSRAPVVSMGKMIGIISLTDMVLRGMCDDLN